MQISMLANAIIEREQAENGISRRHIRGSKIAEVLQSVLYSTRKTQKLSPICAPRATGALKGGPFGFFQHFCCKTSKKLKGDPMKSLKILKKISRYRKKLNGGLFGIFQHHSVAKRQKN